MSHMKVLRGSARLSWTKREDVGQNEKKEDVSSLAGVS